MTDYAIGYGKPPVGRRFAPGQSGNPRGRPRHRPEAVEEIAAAVLNSTVRYAEGGRKRLDTRFGVVIRALVDKAVAGDIASAADILKYLRQSKLTLPGSLQIDVTDWLPEDDFVAEGAGAPVPPLATANDGTGGR